MKNIKENKMDYAKDKQYTIPAAFTAMNGAFETYVLTAGVSLEGEEGQADLLRVLEVLRSNGAQPVVTTVEGNTVKFSIEQSWAYGYRGADRRAQVSARAPKADACADIEAIFGEVKAVDGETKLFDSVEFVGTMGNLVAAEDETSSS